VYTLTVDHQRVTQYLSNGHGKKKSDIDKRVERETKQMKMAAGPAPTATNVVRYFSKLPVGWDSGRPQTQYGLKRDGKLPDTVSQRYLAAKEYFYDHLSADERRRITDAWNLEKLELVRAHELLCESVRSFAVGDAHTGQGRYE
jgi:hypothetical protein